MARVRAVLAVVAIVLILAPAIAAQASALPTDSIRFSTTPPEGAIGSSVIINGNVTVHNETLKNDNDTIDFYFGNMLVAEENVKLNGTLKAPGPNATFLASFNVPMVDNGTYSISVKDRIGGTTTAPFNVTYGVNNLIASLREVQASQGSSGSNLSALVNQLESSVGQGFAQVNNQLHSVNETVSSLSKSVSTSSNDVQSVYPLLVLFVALEGVVIGLVFVSIILTLRRRNPRGRLDEVEVIES